MEIFLAILFSSFTHSRTESVSSCAHSNSSKKEKKKRNHIHVQTSKMGREKSVETSSRKAPQHATTEPSRAKKLTRRSVTNDEGATDESKKVSAGCQWEAIMLVGGEEKFFSLRT
jgi:hypothetical protein